MPLPELRPGDVFASRNPMALGRAINAVQKFWSDDNQSQYSHAGIIYQRPDKTLEALWTVKSQSLSRAYAGSKIIIARPKADTIAIQIALAKLVAEHYGNIYPAWRLLFHLFPPTGKYFSAGGRFLVCSELVAKFEHMIKVRHGQYMGTNPDTLVDEWRRWRNFIVLGEFDLAEVGNERDSGGPFTMRPA